MGQKNACTHFWTGFQKSANLRGRKRTGLHGLVHASFACWPPKTPLATYFSKQLQAIPRLSAEIGSASGGFRFGFRFGLPAGSEGGLNRTEPNREGWTYLPSAELSGCGAVTLLGISPEDIFMLVPEYSETLVKKKQNKKLLIIYLSNWFNLSK